jgi:ABC-type transporter Mla subunit MlaD
MKALNRLRPLRQTRRPSVEELRRRHVLWGAATILLATVIVVLVFRGVPGGGGPKLTIITVDSFALRAATATKARIAGVDAGRVTAIEPAPGRPGFSAVTVELKPDTPTIRQDATVKIRPRLFLEGNFFLDIAPGTPGAPPLGGRAIPPGATTVAVAADEVFSVFDGNTREDLRTTLRNLGRTLDGGGAGELGGVLRALPAPTRDLSVVARALRGRTDGDLADTVRESSRVMDVLARDRTALSGVLRDGARTFAATGAQEQGIRGTLSGLDRVSRAAGPALRQIDSAIDPAEDLIDTATPLARRLPSTLDLAEPALRATSTVARRGRVQRLLRQIRPTARSVANAAEPAADALAAIRPVANCLKRNIIPILKTEVPDGPLSSGQPLYRDILSASVAFGGQIQNYDANGPYERFLVSVGDYLVSTGSGGGRQETRASEPILGSIPPKRDAPPPYRPDVACETQDVPRLAVAPTPFGGRQRKVPIDRDRVRDAVKTFVDEHADLRGTDKAGIRPMQDALARALGAAPPKTGAPSTSPVATDGRPAGNGAFDRMVAGILRPLNAITTTTTRNRR